MAGFGARFLCGTLLYDNDDDSTPTSTSTSMPSALDCDDDESYPPYEICQIKGVNRHYYTQKPCGNCISPFRFAVLLALPLLLSTAKHTHTHSHSAICCSLLSLSYHSRTCFSFRRVYLLVLVFSLASSATVTHSIFDTPNSPFWFRSLCVRAVFARLSVLLRFVLLLQIQCSPIIIIYFWVGVYMCGWVRVRVCVCVCPVRNRVDLVCLCAAHIVYTVQWKWIQKQGAY